VDGFLQHDGRLIERLILRLRIRHTKQRFESARASKIITYIFIESTRNLHTASIANEPCSVPILAAPGNDQRQPGRRRQ
jgi:hypothetical protein